MHLLVNKGEVVLLVFGGVSCEQSREFMTHKVH